SQPADSSRVSGQRGDLLACPDIPELDVAVMTARRQGLPVRGKGHGSDHVLVTGQGDPCLACSNLPKEDGTILAARGQSLAVRGEDQTGDGILVSLKGRDHQLRSGAP